MRGYRGYVSNELASPRRLRVRLRARLGGGRIRYSYSGASGIRCSYFNSIALAIRSF